MQFSPHPLIPLFRLSLCCPLFSWFRFSLRCLLIPLVSFRCTALFLCVLPLFAWSRSPVRSFYQFHKFAFSRAHSALTISRVKTLLCCVFTVFLRVVTLFTDFNVSLFFLLSPTFPLLLPLRYLTNCDLTRNNLSPSLKLIPWSIFFPLSLNDFVFSTLFPNFHVSFFSTVPQGWFY